MEISTVHFRIGISNETTKSMETVGISVNERFTVNCNFPRISKRFMFYNCWCEKCWFLIRPSYKLSVEIQTEGRHMFDKI